MKRGFWGSFDYITFVVTLFILSIGLLTIYSITLGGSKGIPDNIFFKQLISAMLGMVAYFIFAAINFKNFRNISNIFYTFCLVFLLITFAWGLETRGSTRWIEIGFYAAQPSEFMKISLIISLANFFSRKRITSLKELILPTIYTIIPAFLVFKQPDLGSSLVIIGVFLAMVIISGLSFRYLLAIMGTIVVSAPLLWRFLKDYQKERILNFLNPSSDPLGSGYNVIQSIIAVGSGQIFGKGFGRGTQSHYNFLPEHHTDFIFATLSEELGLIGAGLLLVLVFILLLRLCLLSLRVRDHFGSLLVFGITLTLFIQFFINIGMNLGVLPVTGITLPLVSYGGSSLLTVLASLGITQSVKIHSDKETVFES